MDKTQKLLNEMCDLTTDLAGIADQLGSDYEDAVYEYDRLSYEEDFLTGPDDDGYWLAEDMSNGIDAADEYLGYTQENLKDFDKHLMKLIALRGKLAEEIGIPIGGKQWARTETYEM
jgi:hypothetical protein